MLGGAPLIAIPLASASGEAALRHGINAAYVAAVQMAGGLPVLLPPNDDTADLVARLDAFDGLLLAGGGDVLAEFYGQTSTTHIQGVDRARDLTELALAQAALARGMPILGICRGAQVLCVAAGGTLHQDVQAALPQASDHRHRAGHARDFLAHTVGLLRTGLLAQSLGRPRGAEVPVNSSHHQAVDTPPPGFEVAARAPDGVIEAIELNGDGRAYALGVQWHPEELVPTHRAMVGLFTVLVQRSAGR